MLYTERYTYYYASLKILCQMEVRKAVKTVGIHWLSIRLRQGSEALFFDSASSDISQYRIGLGWEVSYRIDSAIVPGENVKYRIYRIIGLSAPAERSGSPPWGFHQAAFALQPCTRLLKPWVTDGVARLGKYPCEMPTSGKNTMVCIVWSPALGLFIALIYCMSR